MGTFCLAPDEPRSNYKKYSTPRISLINGWLSGTIIHLRVDYWFPVSRALNADLIAGSHWSLANTGSPRLARVNHMLHFSLYRSLSAYDLHLQNYLPPPSLLCEDINGGAIVSLNNVTFWVRRSLFKRDVGSARFWIGKSSTPIILVSWMKFSVEQRTNIWQIERG